MLKQSSKIFNILIALLMLSGGNFVYALAHGDCFISENGHSTCEMECCQEDPCDTDTAEATVNIVDDSDSCCKTHIEQTVMQDTPVLLLLNKTETNRTNTTLETVQSALQDQKFFFTTIHKLKTTNILLITAAFRI